MASGMEWFRWHHGSVTDPKFQLVARRARARLGDVIAVWAFLLEAASAHEDRGAFGHVDAEVLDVLIGCEEGGSGRIMAELQGRGMLADGRITAWERRQPRREDATAAERKRRQRERERVLTPGHAASPSGTPREEQSRTEQSRAEPDVVNTPDGVLVGATADADASNDAGHAGWRDAAPAGPSELAEPDAKAPQVPPCPTRRIIAAYHRHLPMCPPVRAFPDTAERMLKTRWREHAERQRLDWWDGLFAHIAGHCPFLVGGKTDFQADLMWLVRPTNFAKVINGNYDEVMRQA